MIAAVDVRSARVKETLIRMIEGEKIVQRHLSEIQNLIVGAWIDNISKVEYTAQYNFKGIITGVVSRLRELGYRVHEQELATAGIKLTIDWEEVPNQNKANDRYFEEDECL